MPLKLSVNKEVRTVDVAPDTPLLWVLRDVLGLKGAKYGCGMGVCGADRRNAIVGRDCAE